MSQTPDSQLTAAQFLAAIRADDIDALKRLVLRHGTEIDLVYEYAGRTTQVEVQGSPLAVAACLKKDLLAAFLVRKGANHGYALHTCRTATFMHTQSVVPMQLAAHFGLPRLCSALMDAGCVDWLEHNYSEDSDTGYSETDPLLLTLSSNQDAMSLFETVGVFRGTFGSRFFEVVGRPGDFQVIVDDELQRQGLACIKEALEWIWESLGHAGRMEQSTFRDGAHHLARRNEAHTASGAAGASEPASKAKALEGRPTRQGFLTTTLNPG
jgi:hypothetical protein